MMAMKHVLSVLVTVIGLASTALASADPNAVSDAVGRTLVVACQYNFKTKDTYVRMGTVPIYYTQCQVPAGASDSAARWIRFAAEHDLAVTFSAQPMNSPRNTPFAERYAIYDRSLAVFARLVEEHDVPVRAVLLDNEVRAETTKAREARHKEALAWIALVKRHLPEVPIVQYQWSKSGYYVPRDGTFKKRMFWSETEPRDYVCCVCYHPDDFWATIIQLEAASTEAQQENLPLAVYLSLGAGYDNRQRFGPRRYDVEITRLTAILLQNVPNLDLVVLYPSPGDKRYAETMPAHVDALLTGLGR